MYLLSNIFFSIFSFNFPTKSPLLRIIWKTNVKKAKRPFAKIQRKVEKAHEKASLISSLSFDTVQRKKQLLAFSYLMKSLVSTIPVLPIGVSRRFWAVAYVCIGASPNKSYLVFLRKYNNI